MHMPWGWLYYLVNNTRQCLFQPPCWSVGQWTESGVRTSCELSFKSHSNQYLYVSSGSNDYASCESDQSDKPTENDHPTLLSVQRHLSFFLEVAGNQNGAKREMNINTLMNANVAPCLLDGQMGGCLLTPSPTTTLQGDISIQLWTISL